jgi:ribonuclease P protein component
MSATRALPSEGGTTRPDQRLSRAQRVTKSRVFKEAFDQGRRFVGRCMVMWLRSGEDASQRLGVVASVKVGGAVQRARAKRRLRECYRRNRHRLAGKWDVILVARGPILKAPWGEVVAELLDLAGRAGILKNEP